MPKRTDIHSILIIGAGPIIIGQACEFDYSGAQACKALREEGYKVILINSNPATIMTDPATADVTYIEPITWQTVEKIIAARAAVNAQGAFLYNLGGLSQKAAERAESAYIRWVGMRELNQWARQVWTSENGGPSGDILQRLAEFKSFLDKLPA